VTYLQFTSDSKQLLSASRVSTSHCSSLDSFQDGTWKLWDLAVDYHGGFVPKVIFTSMFLPPKLRTNG
jgi:hypothetical protein